MDKPTDINEFADLVRLIKEREADVLVSKQLDYGPGNIGNCPLGPVAGLIVRLYDKLARLANLHESGRLEDASHEAASDTALDIANYGTILAMVLADVWPDA